MFSKFLINLTKKKKETFCASIWIYLNWSKNDKKNETCDIKSILKKSVLWGMLKDMAALSFKIPRNSEKFEKWFFVAVLGFIFMLASFEIYSYGYILAKIKLQKFFFSKLNVEILKKKQNSIFIIIWCLMCVEQVKKKKNEKKNWPHEKKSKDKYHLFT